MSAPPDHLGGERYPIAATVPSPIDLHSDAIRPAVRSDQLQPNQFATRGRSGWRARRLIGQGIYSIRSSARASAKEPKNGVVNAPRRREPKGKRRAKKTITAPWLRSMQKARTIQERTSYTTASDIPVTTAICGEPRRMTAIYPSGYLGRAQAVPTRDRSMQLRSWTGC